MSSSREANRGHRIKSAFERFVALGVETSGRCLASGLQLVGPWHKWLETSLAKRRRLVAVLVSLGLHALLIACLLLGVTSNISGGGAGGIGTEGSGTGAGIGVELVSMQQALPDALKVKQPDPENSADADAVTAPELSTDATATTVIDAADTPSVVQPADTTPATAAVPTTNAAGQSSAGGVGQGGQSSGINDALWKQIEPCWNRLAGTGSSGVMLRITFSPLGNVAQTEDGATTAPPADPKSYATAVQALAECGPYVSAGSRENVIIAFPGHSIKVGGRS